MSGETATLIEGKRVLTLVGNSWLIGRQAPAELLFPYPQVSRSHARLEFRDGAYFLTDLESRFGTYCRGQQVGSEPMRLQDGDLLVLGGVIEVRFSDPSETRGGRRLGRLRGLWLDEAGQDTWVDGRLLQPQLSAAQFGLLRLLYTREGEFVTRDEACRELWPDQCRDGVSEEALDGLIKRVRGRLREVEGHGYLEVKRGLGLRLRAPDSH